MGLLAQTLRPLSRALGLEGPQPLTASNLANWAFGARETVTGLTITPESSLQITAVYACVNVIAQDVASLPLHVYRRLDPRGKERAKDHYLYWLLRYRPNRHMTSMQFRMALQGHLLTWGNAYAEIERDRAGRVIALWPLRPDRMEKPEVSAAGTLMYRYTLPNGQKTILSQVQVLHLRGLSSNGIIGYSPITLQRESLGWAQATKEFGARFYGNNAQPGGALLVDKRLSSEAHGKLKSSWEASHQGLSNAHRVAILEEGIKWQQIGIPPDDAQFLDTMNFQTPEICGMFRVAPHKVAHLLRATFSNIEEQDLSHVKDTIRPWLEVWEQQLQMDVFLESEQDRYFAEHLIDALLRGAFKDRVAGLATEIQNGILSINDAREIENMNPILGGDDHYIQQNMMPVSMASDVLKGKMAAKPSTSN